MRKAATLMLIAYLAFPYALAEGGEGRRGEVMDGVKLTGYTPNANGCKADAKTGGQDASSDVSFKPSENAIGKEKNGFVMVAATRRCTHVADKYAKLSPAKCKKKGGKVGVTSHLLGCFFKVDAPGMEDKIFFAGDTYGKKENSRKIDIAHTCKAMEDRKKAGNKNPQGKITILSCPGTGFGANKTKELTQMAAVQSRQFKHQTPSAVAANDAPAGFQQLAFAEQ